MESLFENKALGRLTLILYGIMALLTLELLPWVNAWLQLVPLPKEFRMTFAGLLTLDTVLVIAIDKVCLFLFPYH